MTSSPILVYVITSLLLVHTNDAQPGPIRETMNGKVMGVTKSTFSKDDVDFFYGIPFAQPPVGPLRFEDPLEPLNWTGTFPATELPTSCPQIDDDLSYVAAHRMGVDNYGEDCLYLNVFQPKTKSRKLAVLLFIHGGSNVVGSGLLFDGGYLAVYGDIIVVTMNYRLAALGFLGTGLPDFRGNYAMMDQIMSMKWIKNNIAFFNGDPDKVTILGSSSGAMDVGLHLLSPLSKGLFRAVICQSGPPTNSIAWKHPRKDPLEEVRNISATLGCRETTPLGIKQCLKQADLKSMTRGHTTYPILDMYEFPVLVDGHFLPDEPLVLLRKKEFTANQFVIGVTTSETDYFAQWLRNMPTMIWYLGAIKLIPTDIDLSEILQFEYTNWKTRGQNYSEIMSVSDMLSDAIFNADTMRTANLVADGGVNVYMYHWDRAPGEADTFDPWFRVPHGIDLFYLFGSPISGHPNYTFTEVDRKMSKYMMDSWSNYVKNGVLGPSSGIPQAQTYDLTNKTYLHFHTNNGQPEMSLRQNLAPRAENFWVTYLPSLIKRLRKDKSVPCTPTTSTSDGNRLIQWNCCTLFVVLVVALVYMYG